jgi:LmbE family N-acetylglucosaminyl deacetylase
MRDRLAEDDAALAVLDATTDRVGVLDEQYRSGPVDHDEIVARLRPLLAGLPEVHVPAAIGRHPDHVATRDAALAAIGAETSVIFYADLPYTLAFGWPSWVDGSAPDPLLDPGRWIAAELADAGLDPATLTALPRSLSAEAAARKQAAVSAYTSQLPALDALAGGRLTDGDASRFELAWRRA